MFPYHFGAALCPLTQFAPRCDCYILKTLQRYVPSTSGWHSADSPADLCVCAVLGLAIHETVAECMIFANRAVAEKIVRAPAVSAFVGWDGNG